MRDVSWNDAVQLSQQSLRAAPMKRFYKSVDVAEAEGGFAVRLDGRGARTPGKAPLIAPGRALAERIAAEWAGQGEIIDASVMRFTRLANTAIDGVAKTLAETRAEIAKYACADLVCYRALEPASLARMQAQAFDPVLEWAQTALGAKFALGGGVIHIAQPEAALTSVRAAVDAYGSPFALAALHGLTSLSGSALIALQLASGALDAQVAWRAAHVDEDFQIAKWGEDEEAKARRATRWREFEACAEVVTALR